MSRVSTIPSATDFACGQSRSVCGPSQPDAGPWQLSQLTPSLTSNVRDRSSAGGFSVWHARHFAAVSALPSPKIPAMRSPTAPVSALYACACLSFTIHVLYSFCSTSLMFCGVIAPWQAVEAQDPGPVYFPAPWDAAPPACAKVIHGNVQKTAA